MGLSLRVCTAMNIFCLANVQSVPVSGPHVHYLIVSGPELCNQKPVYSSTNAGGEEAKPQRATSILIESEA